MPTKKKKTKKPKKTFEEGDDIKVSNLDSDLGNSKSNQDLISDKLLTKSSTQRGNNTVGTFKSMNLSQNVMKGLTKLGYKFPTPIQRKAIPLLMQGKDLVAMARTGSGKTCAFLIPLIEKLQSHSTTVGIRALILGPTRELSVQTRKFLNTLSSETNLKICTMVGGESIDYQFNQLTNNPDIVVATPGRLLHILKETGLGLNAVQYVVVDEADRCFEMGLASQLEEIIHKLPSSRQMTLFSATMPTALVEFAKAGLQNPELVRLDADIKISPDLKIDFFTVKSQEKTALLLYTLQKFLKPDQQAIIFASTRHHVEFLHELLSKNEIDSTLLYGTMDPTARKIAIGKFKAKKTNILIVTDLASRGIDVPLLDLVINYDFPPKPKIFVHRVGRTGRNGMMGKAISFVANDEIPYMIDLFLFLGRPLQNIPKEGQDDFDGFYGKVHQSTLESYDQTTNILNDQYLHTLWQTSEKAYKLYYETRPSPSKASLQRAKTLTNELHPLILSSVDRDEIEKTNILQQIKNFKPQVTVFEIQKNTSQSQLMTERRKFMNLKKKPEVFDISGMSSDIIEKEGDDSDDEDEEEAQEDVMDEEEKLELKDALVDQNERKKRFLKFNQGQMKEEKKSFRDEKYYISSEKPVQEQIEDKYYSLGSGLDQNVFDLGGDENSTISKNKQVLMWDVKKKKYVRKHLTAGQHVKNNKIINEAGVEISKDSKADLYKKWKDTTKKRIQLVGEEENKAFRMDDSKPLPKVKAPKLKKGEKPVKSELKTPDQIEKVKKQKEKALKKQKMKEKINKYGLGAVRRKLEIDGMRKKQEQIMSSKVRVIVKDRQKKRKK